MKLGVMQPYFFPYIGYFQLMNYVDEWVIFDEVQFIDKGWMNRNRVLHPDLSKQWQFITVPLAKRGQFDRVMDINIVRDPSWRDAIMGKLTAYRKAPFYRETAAFVHDCLADAPESLNALLESTLRKTASYLNISTPISVQSRQAWALPEVTHAGQWAVEISKVKGANSYVNPIGGSGIFRQAEFDAAGVELKFLKPTLRSYVQYRGGDFVEGLSIIDVLMWNDKAALEQMLKQDFTLLSKQQVEHG
ncbi:MAG: WbqC family protein [Pseudomonas putida]|jgi:hypothetical protein|nr:WbqC family protein [Pseudomonas putida]